MTTSPHLTNLHASCAIFPGGMYRGTLQAATGLSDTEFTAALDFAILVGQITATDGRYQAREVCPVCGFGAGDRYYAHAHRDGCDTSPADYAAGYPIPA